MERKVPKWLEDIQENSWELELLISGGAIFSLFQLSDFFTESIASLNITNALPGTDLFLIFGSFSIQILTLGFVLHLSLRSFWLALVCLNYVYPQGIQKQKITWKKPFKTTVEEKEDLYDPILKTDQLCGLVMYQSIVSTFLLAGIMLLVFVLLTIPGKLFLYESYFVFGIYLKVFLAALLLYILDLLLFGFLRKTPVISFLVYPVFRLFDLISLRFLFQRSLWLFNTNIPKSRFLLFSSVFFAVALLYSYSTLYKSLHWPNVLDQRLHRHSLAESLTMSSSNYLDEHNGKKITHFAIPSKVISGNFLELFIVYRKSYDWDMEDTKATYLSEMAQIKIDDSLYHHLRWHPHWRAENDQLGITTLIPVGHLAEGEHVLTVASTADSTRTAQIPFWIDKN